MPADAPRVILRMGFASPPPWGGARRKALRALAHSIAASTPGRAGELYALTGRDAARACQALRKARVTARGAAGTQARIRDIGMELSAIVTQGLPA